MGKEKPNKKSDKKKIIALVAIVAIVLVLAKVTGFLDFISDVDAMQSYFRSLGLLGYGIYLVLYIIIAVFMFPASVITVVSGIVFGPILGGLLALLGATIGATIAFIIAKYIARDYIVQKFEGNKFFDKIEKGVEENGTSFLILTRLVPVFPYNVQNYAYGVTNMSVVTFALVSLICMAPGAFIYAFMAGEIVTNGVSIKLLVQFGVAGFILFLVSLIPKYIAKKKGINLED